MPAHLAATLIAAFLLFYAFAAAVLSGPRVEIRTPVRFNPPGEYPVTVRLEPHDADRLLRIEADGQPGLYRSTDETLRGDKAAKIRQVWFILSEGCYYFAATIYDNSKALASTVSGPVAIIGREGNLCPSVEP